MSQENYIRNLLNIKDEKETFNPNNIYKDMKPELLFARIDKEKKLKEIEETFK